MPAPGTILMGYKVGAFLGKGSFGEIYEGREKDGEKDSAPVALKIEPVDKKLGQLRIESNVYRALHKDGNALGIPRCIRFETVGRDNVMAMDVLSPKNLHDLLSDAGGKFSPATTAMLGYHMLARIELVHTKLFIHRDIKPENFAFRGKELYLFDFGFAKKYVQSWSEKTHIRFIEGKSMTGTMTFCSVHTHLGHEQSRRDDLEMMAYTLLLFLHGRLPWMDLHGEAATHVKMREMKLSWIVTDDVPAEIRFFLDYSRTLRFEECPDYAKCRAMLEAVLRREGVGEGVITGQEPFQYDWLVLRQGKRGREEIA